MESASTSQDGNPSSVAPKLSVERTTDDADGSPSPSGSHEALQNNIRIDTQSYRSCQSEIDPELAGLDALEDGRPGERPAYPFTTLIRYAIKGSPNGRLLLEDIYNAIQTRYPYFASAPCGWKNSVRHTLSLMTCFEKVPRLLTEPGKGSYWTVNDSMPHAKPSRVRIRKRKTRIDDDNTLLETPRSAPNALYPESPVGENPKGSEQHRHLFPYDHPGVSVRRHSSYGQTNAHDQLSRYDYNLDKASRSYSRNDSPWVEDGQPHVGGRGPEMLEVEPSYPNSDDSHPTSPRHEGHEGDSIAAGGTGASKSVNYRSVLMSELNRLRDVIARRDDIDDEWCRVMVERIRGTGLLEQV